MYKIVKAEKLAANIFLMEVEAPRVAKHCLPGQFVIVKMDEEGERIPLTICDYSREKGTITIVFQPIGESTMRMAELKEGDAFIADGWNKPEGLCSSAWESMSPFVLALASGGENLYDGWMKNPKSAMISCNDGFRPVSFYIEALDEDAD